jgi:HB1/ASXL restriction endonuclease-like protein with HTH domain
LSFLDAAVTVLEQEGEPLHWTRIQDLALRRGYLDPFEEPDIRRRLLAALAEGVAAGVLVRTEHTGVFALAPER